MVLPALVSGFILAVLQALALFGSPAILALPAGFHTITTQIWSFFQFPPKTEMAAAFSIPLLLATALLLLVQKRLLGRRGYAAVGGKGGAAPRDRRSGAGAGRRFAGCLAVMACSIFLPYGILAKAALSRAWAQPLTWDNLTLGEFLVHLLRVQRDPGRDREHARAGRADGLRGRRARRAAGLRDDPPSRASATSWSASSRWPPWSSRAWCWRSALFIAYTRPPLLLYGTLWILFIAYLTKEMPVGYAQSDATFRGIPPELEDAGRILGAGRLRVLRDVTAPLARSGIIAAWCFIFIGVIRELSASIILFTPATKVMSVVIFDLKEEGQFGAIAVLGLVMLVDDLRHRRHRAGRARPRRARSAGVSVARVRVPCRA